MSSNSRSPSPSPNGSASGSNSPSPEPHQNDLKEHKEEKGLSTDAGPSSAPSNANARQDSNGNDGEAKNDENDEESKDNTEPTIAPVTAANAHVNGDWQAVWSPPHNTYYFHNMRTGETTWTNPLADSSSASNSIDAQQIASSSHYDSLAAAAAAQGIDPELAYLDPSLAGPSSSSTSAASGLYTAKFNARTGQFAKPDARDPDHVSEYERMKRMNSFYFDMDAWQKEVEERNTQEAENGKKRKKPTKKDIVGVFSSLSYPVMNSDTILTRRICTRNARSKRS